MTLHNPRLYDYFEKIYIHEYTFTYLKKYLQNLNSYTYSSNQKILSQILEIHTSSFDIF